MSTRSKIKRVRGQKNEDRNSDDGKESETDDAIDDIVKESAEEREDQMMKFVETVNAHMNYMRETTANLIRDRDEQQIEIEQLHKKVKELREQLNNKSKDQLNMDEDINYLHSLMKKEAEQSKKNDKLREEQIKKVKEILEKDYVSYQNMEEMETRNQRRRDQRGQNTQSGSQAANRIRFNAPSFNGTKTEQPMKFLRELRNYCNVIDSDDEETRYIISQSLKGIASEWWQVAEDESKDWADFVRRFTARFWSEARQSEIREKLQFGKYSSKNGLRQCEYAMRLFSQARELTTRPTEHEIVRMMSSHFHPDIHAAILSSGNYSRESLFGILERFDNAGFIGRKQEYEKGNEYAGRREGLGYYQDKTQRKWEPRGQYQREEVRDVHYTQDAPREERWRNNADFNKWRENRQEPAERNGTEPRKQPQNNTALRSGARINVMEEINEQRSLGIRDSVHQGN